MELISQRLILLLRIIVIIPVFFMLLLNASETVKAASFCVSNPTELLNALSTASNNTQDDEIQIVQGLYNGSFVYASATESYNLAIKGGYTNRCISREADPKNTVLDANNTGTVLVLSSDGLASDLVVEGLTLRNGNTTNNNGGDCMQ